MADFKDIAKMQIGGPKYPSKKRINLYQREFKKGIVVGELAAFGVFLVFLYGFAQIGIVQPLQEAERAEMAYERMERQLDAMKRANSVMPEVTENYAHHGNAWQNDAERLIPDRLMMMDVMKNKIFPLCDNIESFSLMDDQISFSCKLQYGSLLSDMVRQIEEDENVRYVTASVEATPGETEDGQEQAIATGKKVTVDMVIYFKQAGQNAGESEGAGA